jgi:hypothetical protein
MLRRYGPLGAAMIAAVILGVAGREAWSALREQAAARSSDAFTEAQAVLESGDLELAMAHFSELSGRGARSYRALAKMQEAAANAAVGSSAEAARLYDEAAAMSNDRLLSHVAGLKAAYLVADDIELATLEQRLAPLMERGAPFELMARELLGAAALDAGDYAKAREAYAYLSVSLDAPEGVRRRAEEALAVIAAADVAPTTDEEG